MNTATHTSSPPTVTPLLMSQSESFAVALSILQWQPSLMMMDDHKQRVRSYFCVPVSGFICAALTWTKWLIFHEYSSPRFNLWHMVQCWRFTWWRQAVFSPGCVLASSVAAPSTGETEKGNRGKGCCRRPPLIHVNTPYSAVTVASTAILNTRRSRGALLPWLFDNYAVNTLLAVVS